MELSWMNDDNATCQARYDSRSTVMRPVPFFYINQFHLIMPVRIHLSKSWGLCKDTYYRRNPAVHVPCFPVLRVLRKIHSLHPPFLRLILSALYIRNVMKLFWLPVIFHILPGIIQNSYRIDTSVKVKKFPACRKNFLTLDAQNI